MFCAEFPQVQFIDLSKIVNVMKAVAIVSNDLWSVTFLVLRCPLNGVETRHQVSLPPE